MMSSQFIHVKNTEIRTQIFSTAGDLYHTGCWLRSGFGLPKPKKTKQKKKKINK